MNDSEAKLLLRKNKVEIGFEDCRSPIQIALALGYISDVNDRQAIALRALQVANLTANVKPAQHPYFAS